MKNEENREEEEKEHENRYQFQKWTMENKYENLSLCEIWYEIHMDWPWPILWHIQRGWKRKTHKHKYHFTPGKNEKNIIKM